MLAGTCKVLGREAGARHASNKLANLNLAAQFQRTAPSGPAAVAAFFSFSSTSCSGHIPRVASVKLNSVQVGDRNSQKPPVLFVHGLLGSLSNFRTPAKKLLEATGRGGYLLDMRNHGGSPHVDDMSFEGLASDLAEFIDEKGIERATIVGHSLGGKMAMTYAMMCPERVEKLVSVDMAPHVYDVRADSTRTVGAVLKGVKSLDLAAVKTRQDADRLLTPNIPDEMFRLFVMQNLVNDGHGGFAWRMNLSALLKSAGDLLGFVAPPPMPLDHPEVLFVAGAKSDYCPAEKMDDARQYFSAVQHVSIPDAGHWVHAERTETFVAHVSKFLG